VSKKPPMLNLNTAALQPFGHGEAFAAGYHRIASTLGMKKIGCTLVQLAPGKRAWPFHGHYGQEECFVILEGEGSIRYHDGTQPLRAGDVIFTPPGPDTAHQIINTSDSTLRYLAFSSDEDPEVCYYPDSDKIGCFTGEAGKRSFRFMAPAGASTDYWDGED